LLSNLEFVLFAAAATDFAIYLVKTLVVQEPSVDATELYSIIDALAKVSGLLRINTAGRKSHQSRPRPQPDLEAKGC
jgi:hypothetical protein